MLIDILQVYPREDYTIYLYFSDGRIKLYDIKPLLEKGVFQKLQDKDFYLNRCTVLNNTLAWDLTGNYDPYNCIDLDPLVLYEKSIEVKDPLRVSASRIWFKKHEHNSFKIQLIKIERKIYSCIQEEQWT